MKYFLFRLLFLLSHHQTTKNMKIETKYDVGQQVWLMKDNNPTSDIIFSVEPTVCRSYDRGISTTINYKFEELGYTYNESVLFSSKEDLIKSL